MGQRVSKRVELEGELPDGFVAVFVEVPGQGGIGSDECSQSVGVELPSRFVEVPLVDCPTEVRNVVILANSDSPENIDRGPVDLRWILRNVDSIAA